MQICHRKKGEKRKEKHFHYNILNKKMTATKVYCLREKANN